MADPFVAVDEWVIGHEGVAQSRRFGFDRGIQVTSAKRHLRLSQGGQDPAEFTNAVSSSRLPDDPAVKIQNFGQSERCI